MRVFCFYCLALCLSLPAMAEDMDGAAEHPMVQRYPGQSLRWQTIENYRPYRVPFGPVTGYRAIDDWVETEGRVTRSFYALTGADRAYDEVYQNFLNAFREAGFEVLGEGISPSRGGAGIGSRQWSGVYFAENPFIDRGEVDTMLAGTSSQGGAGAFVARTDRPAGEVFVVVHVERHSDDLIGTLIDIVEVNRAELGLVAVDAEAIGRDLTEKGRVVLDGILFDFDSATLQAESDTALAAVATYLTAHPDQTFYVVGHTDAKGSFDYNRDLSAARATSVVAALEERYGIPREQLEPHGVGPLVPVFSNASDAGRDRNRRVELVERP